MKTQLTELEKYILSSVIFQPEKKPDYKEMYDLSHPEKRGTKNVPSVVSKWKNSHLVQEYLNTLASKKQDYENSLKRAAIRDYIEQNERDLKNGVEGETTNTVKKLVLSDNIDFTDRDQFINYLNHQANNITDAKLKTDYIKMLSDLLRFKEDKPENDSENSIQRFYMPLTCSNCALYKAKNQELTNK